jgi:hypothetical protein
MISLALAAWLRSQSTPTPRSPCSAPEYRQFDFWIGDWEVHNPKGQLAGTNHIESIEDGCGLQETWTSANGGVTGRSLNAYRPGTRRWHQTWLGNDGLVLLLEGRFIGDRMVLEGTSPAAAGKGNILNRITWSRVGREQVRQFWEQSSDAGKTWTVAFDGTYSPRRSP